MDNGSLFDPPDPSEGGTSKELAPFEFPFTGQEVRAFLINGAPWFVALDACAILALGNSRSAVATLDEDERDVHTVDTPGGPQQMQIISESGLYSLILRSRKPEAKAFKKWITSDVLPSIRKSGSYGLVPKQFDPHDLDHVAQLAQIAADQQRQIKARDEKIAELLPGHELAETYAAANGTMTLQTFARTVQQWATQRKIKVNQDHVFAFLGQIGMLIRSKARSDCGQATATAVKAGWCENATTDVKTKTRGTILKTYAKMTPEGVDHAWKRIFATVGEFGTLDPAVIRPKRPEIEP